MAIFFGWILFSFVAGAVGSDRKIGFAGAFFLSLFLSPLVGLIIAFSSQRNSPEEVIVKNDVPPAESNTGPFVPPSLADELLKLNELKEKGVITAEEFEDLKAKTIKKPTE